MNILEQTLLEQMRITGIEVDYRKFLVGFTQADADYLLKYRSFVTSEIDNIVNKLFKRITSIDEFALVIGDADSLLRFKKMIRQYIIDLFSGVYDLAYINHRLRIGLVHKRIGVTPKIYLSAFFSLYSILKEALAINQDDPRDLLKTNDILLKILIFDLSLIFDTYIRSLMSEVELTKNRIKSYAENLEDLVAERTSYFERKSHTDSQTSLYNKRGMYEHLRRELAVAQRELTPLTLVFFDLDGFKQLNDKLGHLEGDQIISLVGDVLRSVLRKGDVACRYGGDEFCFIMPRATAKDAEIVSSRLINKFDERKEKKHENITLSIGIAQVGPKQFVNIDELIKNADDLMYEAKEQSGHQVRGVVIDSKT